ncbi:MAG: TIGR04150 pseudo-rSAM protein [Prevotellaceae bacterium]|jgi:pseudo-rSAM protein|nr:TIGR04150 pseudo-rSAM protein [Prevotellaceae bacterium]
MNKKLTIYSDTFIWIKKPKGLIYNSQNGHYLLFQPTSEIESICKYLNNFDNLYSIIFDDETLNSETQKFMQNIEERHLGILTNVEANIVSLPPLLNILNAVEKLKADKSRSESENILKYFSALTVYTGGKCANTNYYKQTFYPCNSNEVLTSETIINFLDNIQSQYLNSINIVFSDILNYSDAQVLIDYLESLQIPTTIYVHYTEIMINNRFLDKLRNNNLTVKIICEIDKDLQNILLFCKNESYHYNFLIKNEEEYNILEEMIENLQIKKYTVIPVFDNNLQFFEEHVFVNESDILATKLSKREIFAHQALNTNFWGALTVLPDGKVYSNLHNESVGTINDSIYDLILNEFHNNYSWRLIRNQKPCCDCIYQWLCPSPSNYEFVIGRMNLCNYYNMQK